MNIGTSGILMEIFVRALASSIAADVAGEDQKAADVAGPTGAADVASDGSQEAADVAGEGSTAEGYKVRQLYTSTRCKTVLYNLPLYLYI